MTGRKEHEGRDRLTEQIAAKETRKIKARRERDRSVWFGLGMFGLVGWSIAVPTVLGIAFGAWIDHRWPSSVSWRLTLLFVGVVVGFCNAWRWMQSERTEGQDDA